MRARVSLPLSLAIAGLLSAFSSASHASNATPHNLILFVPDGLRALKVTPETAPAMMNHQPGTSQCTASATTPAIAHGIARRGPFHAGTSIAA